jgi:hypothetical protein
MSSEGLRAAQPQVQQTQQPRVEDNIRRMRMAAPQQQPMQQRFQRDAMQQFQQQQQQRWGGWLRPGPNQPTQVRPFPEPPPRPPEPPSVLVPQ